MNQNIDNPKEKCTSDNNHFTKQHIKMAKNEVLNINNL